ncbi:fumarylacetoacetate hydrolase family protein [Marinospirillum alkaliphilum]|uniref:2-keto-4-pentenoate hydratase/2-oxohepta-3-ene-1,7-dioic acid hydratase (Catechol pathway) n=1 Tax=Marinospirillum alkaliphilum DSM 21637 TaxID=1122209 RepID=A0A1K1WP10_9GAMM|nr:fumarylacetoacetate hydrolase family protein [Marinospirillum alkaliphilum]SFX39121.1 2-keto-4-pentenoate hydratase/2-oxohepta-3-ene-1,7-dioic acid hydratase (catechol pathway) [Marinospirillum alkaliphilum DSM 21637]
MISTRAFVPTLQGQNWAHSLGKIVCVGRNYAEHAAELNNPVPEQPLLFIKPVTCAVPMGQPLQLPQGRGEVHYETEIALLIGQPLQQAAAEQAMEALAGVGLALDLTLRGLQSELKKQGHPWERAKAWDGACPLSEFVPASRVDDWSALALSLSINGELRQQGSAAQMLTPIAQLLSHISETFTLLPGDVVITGTPAGVGVLASGDQLQLSLQGLLEVETTVI